MNPSPTSPQHETLFEAVRNGEKKRVPLVAAMKITRIDKGNVTQFVSAMNELGAPLSSELIALTWPDLDIESRMVVMREWLEGKDKEQQAGGYHTLSARLLAMDPDSSMTLLDHVVRLTSSSTVCLKRVVSATKWEWIGTSLDQARFRRIDPLLLTTASRLTLLDWLCDACATESSPLDNEKRKADLLKQSKERSALVLEWLANLSTEKLPEMGALAVARGLSRLRPQAKVSVSAPTVQVSAIPRPAAPLPSTQESSAPPTAPVPLKAAPLPAVEEPNDMFREVFSSIKNLFQKTSKEHAKEMQSAASDVAALKAALDRSERDAAATREANTRNSKQLSELEEKTRVLKELNEQTDTALSVANATLSSVQAQLESERQQTQALRQEGHEAVARETQRERERLLGQLGQRIGNIIESYREIRSRGPLPEGTPAMIGNMMDELLSRLEAAGVRLKRD